MGSNAAAPRAVIYAYPWALHDQGLDQACDELLACGLGGVQLALNYHVGTYLTPRSPVGRVAAGDLGSLFFEPRPDDDWPFAPLVSPRVTDTLNAAAVTAALRSRGLDVTGWLIFCFDHALARSRPELALRNAFGDVSGAHVCPANPAVRRYALALTGAALRSGSLAGVHAEALGYMPFDHGWLNRKAATTPGARARLLLSLCFCEQCQAAAAEAGVRVEPFREAVRQSIDELLGRLPDLEEDEDDAAWGDQAFGGDLAAYVTTAATTVAALQSEVAALVAEAGARFSSSLLEPDGVGVNGDAPRTVAGLVGEYRVRIEPGMTQASLVRAVDRARLGVPSAATAYGYFQLERFESELEFRAMLKLAAKVGLGHYRFYEHSVLTRRHVQWLRGARSAWT